MPGPGPERVAHSPCETHERPPQGGREPRSAIRRGHVLVIEGEQARKRAVTVETLIGDRALVTGDIRSGDRVILSHLDSLEQGSRVRVTEPTGPVRASVDGTKGSHGGMKP